MRLLPSLRLNQRTCWRRMLTTPNPAKAMESSINAHWPNDGTGTAPPLLGCPAGVVALHEACCKPPLLQAAPPATVAVTVLAVLVTTALPAIAEI